MAAPSRRLLLGGLTFTAGAALAHRARAAGPDGHAAGYDAAAAPDPVRLIPRRTGDPVAFTASLDRAPLKQTSGGWAREVTARTLPLQTGIAGAHLFLNPGGAREMHWHNSDEWALVLGGQCQVTAIDPAGEAEVVNLGPGDLWYFPRGHAHAIQTLGDGPCHAVLAFDDGLYSEHGTFGISDWMSRIEPATLAQAVGLPPGALDRAPAGETYIMQGEVIPLDSPQARAEQPLPPGRTHRHRMMAGTPWASPPGGTVHLADRGRFPVSGMAAVVTRLDPGAMQHLHWHPGANEWHYVSRGQVRISLFAPDKRLAVADLVPGDCAYIPANCGHMVQNTGSTACEMIGVLDSPDYAAASLSDWLHGAPRHLLANNLGMAEAAVPAFPQTPPVLPRPG